MNFDKIPVKSIKIAGEQSRKEFNEEGIKQLAASIKEVGQLQPIIVHQKDGDYILIAGERRLRAIKSNSKENEVAAVILTEDLDTNSLRQIQLIENLQRQDLNPLERALAIQKFIDEEGLTKKDASQKLGVPRTTLTEWLNILDVEKSYQDRVLDEDSALTLSHITLAKALVSRTGDPSKKNSLLDGVIKYNLSKRETKDIIDLFNKYLNMSMEEAIATILIKRERKKLNNKKENTSNKKSNPVNKLIKSLNRTGNDIEQAMSRINKLEKDDKENLIDEFLYIYQLMEIIIPEFKNEDIREMIAKIKFINN